ncbi:hypothetical protein D3C75_828760 [compost metagenome]
MLITLLGVEKPLFGQVADHIHVAILHKTPLEFLHLRGVASGRIHHIMKVQPMLLDCPVILLTVGGCGMHNAGAAGIADIVRIHHAEAVGSFDTVKRRLIGHAYKLGSLLYCYDLVIRLHHLFHQIQGDNIGFPLLADQGIVHALVHSQCDITRQGPWSGGPGQEHQPLFPVGKLHSRAQILNILITLGDLMGAQGSLAAWAIRAYPVALVQQSFLVDGGQEMPDAFDVIVG